MVNTHQEQGDNARLSSLRHLVKVGAGILGFLFSSCARDTTFQPNPVFAIDRDFARLQVLDAHGRRVSDAWAAYWDGEKVVSAPAEDVWDELVLRRNIGLHRAESISDPSSSIAIGARGYLSEHVLLPVVIGETHFPFPLYACRVRMRESIATVNGFAHNDKGEPVAGVAIVTDCGDPVLDLATSTVDRIAKLAAPRGRPYRLRLERDYSSCLLAARSEDGHWRLDDLQMGTRFDLLFIPDDRANYSLGIVQVELDGPVTEVDVVVHAGGAARIAMPEEMEKTGESLRLSIEASVPPNIITMVFDANRPLDGEFLLQGIPEGVVRLSWTAIQETYQTGGQAVDIRRGAVAPVEIRR